MKKVALIILDGFGVNLSTPSENAIILANTPNFDKLFDRLYTQVDASGKLVWLPEGQMWNSEVGHLTLGAWRILKQSLVKIDDMFDDGSFEQIPSFQNMISHLINYESCLHVMGLFGPGWVHASQNHFEKFLKLIPSEVKVYLHLFGDGRDLAPKSMVEYLEPFLSTLPENVQLATISGRYYAMDRDNNWDRVRQSYDVIMNWQNKYEYAPMDFVQSSYEEWITDEFLLPTSFGHYFWVENNDAVVFLNFRSDRAKQLTKVITDQYFDKFETKSLDNICFISMTKYFPEYKWDIFIEDDSLANILPEIISKLGLKQLHIAETEKFAHVTKFFNWWNQIVFDNEDDILIPSHKVATYDQDPEMSAQEIYDAFINNAADHEFTVVNFANWDMVGHTWNMQAAIKAVEKLDEVIWSIINFCKQNDIELLITADHWNCEEMWTPENPKTSHSTNLVPFWYISWWEVQKTVENGGLADIAPTVLKIMDIEIPMEMNGKVLL